MRLLFVASLLMALAALGWTKAGDPSIVVGLLIAVGDKGRTVSSTDGIRWTNDQRWHDEESDLLDITFGAGTFVAVGGGALGGYIRYTHNGQDWHGLPQLAKAVTTVTFGHGKFVAEQGGKLLSSSDGEKFTAGQGLDWKGDIHALRSACGDTEAGFRFVIVGDVYLQVEKKLVPWRAVTEDGVTYQHTALDTPAAVDVAYGSGHFVVVGPAGLIESSHDGQAWERHAAPPTENFSRVIWTGSRFVVSGGMYVWTSPDGLSWKKEGYPFPAKAVLGQEGLLFLGLGLKDRSEIFYSHDFTRWMVGKLPPGPSFNAIAFGQLAP